MESIKKEIIKATENFSSDFGREFIDDNFLAGDSNKCFIGFESINYLLMRVHSTYCRRYRSSLLPGSAVS